MKNKGGTGSPIGNLTGTSDSGGSKSLKDLLASGVAQKCTYTTTMDTGSTEGTTYISGGKIRGDFSTTVSGKTTQSHMISDSKTSYVWTEGEKTGFKTTISEADTSEANSNDTPSNYSGSTTGADLSQKADYKCAAWVVDGSVFTPPATVKFTDLSEMFKTPAGN